jgi:hypothetical protein
LSRKKEKKGERKRKRKKKELMGVREGEKGRR